MALVVQKFGGSSLATPEKVLGAARRAVAAFDGGSRVVMVCSAQGDHTDRLIAMAQAIDPNPDPREMDTLLAVGEQMSIALMAIAIHRLGHRAISLLGRGGSDTTAVALAAALRAGRCDIFTDVEGVYTADPRIVPQARWIPTIDYDELLELASLGARVMHSRAVELAKRFEVPFRVRPSFNESEGTLVTDLSGDMEQMDVRAAAMDANEAKITLRHVDDRPGVAAIIFAELARACINVDMIVQNASAEGRADVSFTVMKEDLLRALEVAEDLGRRLGGATVESDENIAKVSIVGVGMRSHSGVAEKMFRALADRKINILMISTSEIKISCVVEGTAGQDALRAVHKAFELDKRNGADDER